MKEAKRFLARRPKVQIAEWVGVMILLAGRIWFLLWPAMGNVRDSFSARDWPTVEAKVITSRTSRYTNGGARTSISYRFRYEYQVNDETYTGWRYSLSAPSGSQSDGVKTYRQGETIHVHYHPEYPGRSVVNAESSVWWNHLVLGTTLFIGFVLFLAVVCPRLTISKRD